LNDVNFQDCINAKEIFCIIRKRTSYLLLHEPSLEVTTMGLQYYLELHSSKLNGMQVQLWTSNQSWWTIMMMKLNDNVWKLVYQLNKANNFIITFHFTSFVVSHKHPFQIRAFFSSSPIKTKENRNWVWSKFQAPKFELSQK
jgi:hypothetical protein